MGVVPGYKNLFYVEIIFIIFWRYYIAFLSKNTFDNSSEKHVIHFMGLHVLYFIFNFYLYVYWKVHKEFAIQYT